MRTTIVSIAIPVEDKKPAGSGSKKVYKHPLPQFGSSSASPPGCIEDSAAQPLKILIVDRKPTYTIVNGMLEISDDFSSENQSPGSDSEIWTPLSRNGNTTKLIKAALPIASPTEKRNLEYLQELQEPTPEPPKIVSPEMAKACLLARNADAIAQRNFQRNGSSVPQKKPEYLVQVGTFKTPMASKIASSTVTERVLGSAREPLPPQPRIAAGSSASPQFFEASLEAHNVNRVAQEIELKASVPQVVITTNLIKASKFKDSIVPQRVSSASVKRSLFSCCS